jgi:hypothetical protein
MTGACDGFLGDIDGLDQRGLQDSADWELGREEARREIDLDQQLAEYQVAVFEMLDEAMRDGRA